MFIFILYYYLVLDTTFALEKCPSQQIPIRMSTPPWPESPGWKSSYLLQDYTVDRDYQYAVVSFSDVTESVYWVSETEILKCNEGKDYVVQYQFYPQHYESGVNLDIEVQPITLLESTAYNLTVTQTFLCSLHTSLVDCDDVNSFLLFQVSQSNITTTESIQNNTIVSTTISLNNGSTVSEPNTWNVTTNGTTHDYSVTAFPQTITTLTQNVTASDETPSGLQTTTIDPVISNAPTFNGTFSDSTSPETTFSGFTSLDTTPSGSTSEETTLNDYTSTEISPSNSVTPGAPFVSNTRTNEPFSYSTSPETAFSDPITSERTYDNNAIIFLNNGKIKFKATDKISLGASDRSTAEATGAIAIGSVWVILLLGCVVAVILVDIKNLVRDIKKRALANCKSFICCKNL